MVFIDYLYDGQRQTFLFGKLNAVLGMSGNDLDAVHDRKSIVRIVAVRLVLGKVHRSFKFADVVIVGSNLAKECISADSFCSGVSEVCDHHDMGICS